VRAVVVGAGAAGLWCAMHAASRGPVVVVAPEDDGATAWAQGGIAAAAGEGDDPAEHAADTLAAGGGLCDPAAVEVLAREAPRALAELRALGVALDERPAREGGHRAPRVWHAGGDATGSLLLGTLRRAVAADGRVRRIVCRAVRVLLDGGRAAGVALEDGSELEADRVILATGGACGIYGRRTVPDGATGEGIVLAWAAGACLADLEFVQFHPTALDVPGHPAELLTEALRGEGAVLRDAHGRRSCPRSTPWATSRHGTPWPWRSPRCGRRPAACTSTRPASPTSSAVSP